MKAFSISLIATATLLAHAATAQVLSDGFGTCISGGKEIKCDGWGVANTMGFKLTGWIFDATKVRNIEDQYEEWCASSQPLLSGLWPAVAYDFSLELAYDAGASREHERQKVLSAWRSEFPASEARAVAEATYWLGRAWNARGGAYARDVPPEAWELFKERLRKAWEALGQVPREKVKCGLWYSNAVRTAHELGMPRAELMNLYEEGVTRFPKFHQIYFAAGRALTPKWGGSMKEFDEFARSAAKKTTGFEGDGMYARLYWSIDNDELRVEGAETPDWRLLRKGFTDLEAKYPESWWNANKFASFACRAKDRDTYLRVRKRIGTAVSTLAWTRGSGPDVCDRRFNYKAE
jgi:hypothetical protein